MTSSRLQEALAARAQVWGGWVVGPTILGPEEFAQAGYDYVGFDVQHGYLDDADVALMLRRLEHVPIATAVRLPSADPAPIGRVLDAGADAVIIAMVESAEQAAAAVAATRYAPAGCAASGRCARASGIDPAALEARASVLRDDRDGARRSPRSTRSARCPGWPGVYVGPADLAISMGHGLADAWTAPGGARRNGTHPGRRHRRRAGHRHPRRRREHSETPRRSMGFRMITLASESQALRRGAAEHLAEAHGATRPRRSEPHRGV